MWIVREIVAAFFGLCAGGITAGGIFTLISTINVIPRLAEKTTTKKSIMLYETMIVWGGAIGSLISLTNFQFRFPSIAAKIILAVYATFSGVFVGCLATALAETLNTIPIFFRRAKLTKGLGYVILAVAIGKALGNILQFNKGWIL
ncbi:MAG: stage V sporulation protein AB [Lachnospiraceae bacterium]|nr:stage V sporulation protein AB [Lachnospiraceae bacterium]